MKLFIDTERLRDLHSGLGQFCQHLGEEIIRQRPADARITFLVPKTRIGFFGPEAGYKPASWRWRFLDWSLGEYDLWHCTHQDSVYLPPQSRRTKLILTIHDLNFLERTDYSEAKKARKLSALQRKVDRAAAITTISEYTASVVREHLTIPDIPLRVIYNGVPAHEKPVDVSATDEVPTEPYFLFLGVIHPKKNLHTLLPLLEAFPDWRLVLAGPDTHPYAHHLREQARNLGIADRLTISGAVDESIKAALYERCGAFLFPSLSEGFGLPVVEAMQFGKPVFLSRLTSLPEIGGNVAYYFNSFEPEDMAETVFNGLSDYAANPFRADRLRQRATQFSWEKAAAAYWELYQSL